MKAHKNAKEKSEKKSGLLALLPFLPATNAGRQEAELFKLLTALGAHCDLKCVPEGQPTAARMAESALTSRGITVYSFYKPPQRNELDSGIRAIITENHSAPVVLVCGLELINRHLFQLRLFAQDRKFAAVLLPEDLHKLEFGGMTVAERIIKKVDTVKILSHAHTLLCCNDADSKKLQQLIGIPALASSAGLKAVQKLLAPSAPPELGVIVLPQALKSAAAALKNLPWKPRVFRAKDLAEMSSQILRHKSLERWLVLCRPFVCAPEIPSRLLFMSELFRDAGALMPAVLRKAAGAAALPQGKLLAEAFALSRRGLFREPFYIHEPTVLAFSRTAFAKTGGTDPRFQSLDYAMTDICLRMYQAGHRSIVAEDLAVFAPDASADRQPTARRADEKETLVRKWGMDGLKFMELLVSELHNND